MTKEEFLKLTSDKKVEYLVKAFNENKLMGDFFKKEFIEACKWRSINIKDGKAYVGF